MFRMSRKQDGPRFIFHGNAMPFGGRIEAVDEVEHRELIKGPPAAALPVVGGWSVATSTGSQCQDVFKWGVTVADCKGEWQGGLRYVTTVTSSISGFTAKNGPLVFAARRLQITMESTHDGPDNQPSFVPTVTIFDGLQLDGAPITFPGNQDLSDNCLATCPTFDEFAQKFGGNGDPRPLGDFVVSSFVRSVNWKDQTFPGNVLSVEGFGNLYFGEVLLNRNNRRVTMVRLAMGCAVQAVAACAEADPNGTWTN
jgi:hypothetical protein